MKTNLFLSVALGATLVLSSCGANAKSEKSSCCDSGQTKAETTCCESKAPAAVLSVDELMANAEANIGQTVSVKGICTHLCAHGAGKMFLMGSDDTQIIRVQASKEIGAFKQECVNSIVEATGVLVETKIDEAYLAQWEAQLNEHEEEHHGEDEGGCSTEKAARGEKGNSTAERIADFRKRIAERNEKEGKTYLSFYHMDGSAYSIQE